MGIFNVNDFSITYESLQNRGFEQITKNTWIYRWNDRGHDTYRWWFIPRELTYDTVRKMFRFEKKKYFIQSDLEFDIIFNEIVK